MTPADSDLGQQATRDPYLFDFVGDVEIRAERDLEAALVDHVGKFLLEPGQGFAFVGRQVRLEIGDDKFFCDLLFYHMKLRCFICTIPDHSPPVLRADEGQFRSAWADGQPPPTGEQLDGLEFRLAWPPAVAGQDNVKPCTGDWTGMYSGSVLEQQRFLRPRPGYGRGAFDVHP